MVTVAGNGADGNATRKGPGKARAPKTAELVADQLRRQIVRGELREGDALPPETALLAEFAVSRPTLREAFRVLESEALITVRRGARGGARVHVPDGEVAAHHAGLVLEYWGATVADVRRARLLVEPPCAGLLAANHIGEDLERLRDALDRAPRANSPQDDFHALVVDLADNKTMKLLVAMLHYLIEVAGVTCTHRPHPGLDSHRRLVDLIEAGDSRGAEELWRQHLLESDPPSADGTESSAFQVLAEPPVNPEG